MDLNKADDRYELVNELLRHLGSVDDAIQMKAVMDYIVDQELLWVIRERLISLSILMNTGNNFGYVLFIELEEMKTSDEDSKWTFPLEKVFNGFIKGAILPCIDSLIEVSRSWNLDDYRARDFQSKLRQKMEMLRNWYKERYDL